MKQIVLFLCLQASAFSFANECGPQINDLLPFDSFEKLTASQQATALDDTNIIYVINSGKVYRQDVRTGAIKHLSGSNRVKALLNYGEELVALRENGDIFVWYSSKEEWVEIGNNAKSILTFDKKTLVALTESGELWAYQGQPGEEQWNITYIPITTNNMTTLMPIATYGGREVAFLDTGIAGVKSVEAHGEDIRILYENGHSKNYGDTGLTLDDVDREFTVTQNISFRFACQYKKKEYLVEHLSLQKESGKLYATLRYRIQGAWFSNSPSYKISVTEIASYLKLRQGISSSHIKEIFEKFIIPQSQGGSWAVKYCF